MISFNENILYKQDSTLNSLIDLYREHLETGTDASIPSGVTNFDSFTNRFYNINTRFGDYIKRSPELFDDISVLPINFLQLYNTYQENPFKGDELKHGDDIDKLNYQLQLFKKYEMYYPELIYGYMVSPPITLIPNISNEECNNIELIGLFASLDKLVYEVNKYCIAHKNDLKLSFDTIEDPNMYPDVLLFPEEVNDETSPYFDLFTYDYEWKTFDSMGTEIKYSGLRGSYPNGIAAQSLFDPNHMYYEGNENATTDKILRNQKLYDIRECGITNFPHTLNLLFYLLRVITMADAKVDPIGEKVSGIPHDKLDNVIYRRYITGNISRFPLKGGAKIYIPSLNGLRISLYALTKRSTFAPLLAYDIIHELHTLPDSHFINCITMATPNTSIKEALYNKPEYFVLDKYSRGYELLDSNLSPLEKSYLSFHKNLYIMDVLSDDSGNPVIEIENDILPAVNEALNYIQFAQIAIGIYFIIRSRYNTFYEYRDDAFYLFNAYYTKWLSDKSKDVFTRFIDPISTSPDLKFYASFEITLLAVWSYNKVPGNTITKDNAVDSYINIIRNTNIMNLVYKFKYKGAVYKLIGNINKNATIDSHGVLMMPIGEKTYLCSDSNIQNIAARKFGPVVIKEEDLLRFEGDKRITISDGIKVPTNLAVYRTVFEPNDLCLFQKVEDSLDEDDEIHIIQKLHVSAHEMKSSQLQYIEVFYRNKFRNTWINEAHYNNDKGKRVDVPNNTFIYSRSLFGGGNIIGILLKFLIVCVILILVIKLCMMRFASLHNNNHMVDEMRNERDS